MFTETHNKFWISFFCDFLRVVSTNNVVLTESNINKADKTHSDWLKIREKGIPSLKYLERRNEGILQFLR